MATKTAKKATASKTAKKVPAKVASKVDATTERIEAGAKLAKKEAKEKPVWMITEEAVRIALALLKVCPTFQDAKDTLDAAQEIKDL